MTSSSTVVFCGSSVWYAKVRLSYRSTTTPRVLSPSARSLKTRLGPIVSSRSCGPDPASSTTAGNGPSPVGIVKVPGSVHGAAPTVTASEWNFDASAYGGDVAGADVADSVVIGLK